MKSASHRILRGDAFIRHLNGSREAEPFLVKKFETTLHEEGTFDYFCVIHNVVMRRVIVVEEKNRNGFRLSWLFGPVGITFRIS